MSAHASRQRPPSARHSSPRSRPVPAHERPGAPATQRCHRLRDALQRLGPPPRCACGALGLCRRCAASFYRRPTAVVGGQSLPSAAISHARALIIDLAAQNRDVIPRRRGPTQATAICGPVSWVPAFAGMTLENDEQSMYPRVGFAHSRVTTDPVAEPARVALRPPSAPAQDHVVAVDQGGAAGEAQDGRDFAGPLADDARRIRPRVGDKAAADLAPVGGSDDHGIAALEGTLNAPHASGQQALARE